ncbi:MAG TPA: FAD-dependent monooxygenase [Oculatellaceae cyanobacterium]
MGTRKAIGRSVAVQSAPQILVVGAGPTGLTVAAELHRHGVACRVVDTNTAPSAHSRALAIQSRTMEVFEIMGVAGRVLDLGWKLNAFNVYDRTHHIVRMTFDELNCPYPFLVSLPQFETERILAGRLHELGGNIEWNTRLTSLLQTGEEVQVTLEHTDGQIESTAYKWVIACDGAHSDVRHLLDMSFHGKQYHEYYVLADIDFETTLDTSEFYIFSRGHTIGGFHPFNAHSARIFCDMDIDSKLTAKSSDKPALSEPSLEQLQQMLSERGPGTVEITKLNWLSMHWVHCRQVQSYQQDRVFLAGDAAHVHSPASGQGMNLGIQDAFNLAWKLADFESNRVQVSVLESYSPERLKVGKEILRMTDFFTRINTERNAIAQQIRNTVGPILSQQEPIREHYRNAVMGLSVNYRDSPIVEEHKRKTLNFSAGPSAGERAPYTVLHKELDSGHSSITADLQQGKHVLLLFAGNQTSADEWTQLSKIAHLVSQDYTESISPIVFAPPSNLPGDSALVNHLRVDSNLAAHTKYNASHACAYLVRPDAYVAFRAIPPSETQFRHYLEKTFRRSEEQPNGSSKIAKTSASS